MTTSTIPTAADLRRQLQTAERDIADTTRRLASCILDSETVRAVTLESELVRLEARRRALVLALAEAEARERAAAAERARHADALAVEMKRRGLADSKVELYESYSRLLSHKAVRIEAQRRYDAEVLALRRSVAASPDCDVLACRLRDAKVPFDDSAPGILEVSTDVDELRALAERYRTLSKEATDEDQA